MKIIRILFSVILLAALTATSAQRVNLAVAAPVSGYALTWSSLDGGGNVSQSAGTGYALSGTLAQPDAGVWSNAHYRLLGGFWQDSLRRLFLPLLSRN